MKILTRAAAMACVGVVTLTLTSATGFAGFMDLVIADGNVSVEVRAFPEDDVSSPSGSLTLSTIPAGATVHEAALLGHDWFTSSSTPSATFAGNPLGSTTAFATDAGFSAYQWDVTSYVTGNGAYAASATGFDQNYGLALVAVFSHPSLPPGRVAVQVGAVDTGNGGTYSTALSGLGGPGELWLHTSADNARGETDEVIRFNGTAVGGPIDANLGPYASLFAIDVTSLAGSNTVDLVVPSDQFGWDIVALHSTGVVIPEPATCALLALGLLGVGRHRRRRRQG